MAISQLVSMVLFGLVAVVASTMAWKGLTAPGLLPFHQAASGRPVGDLTPGELSVAVALTRSLGLGFTITSLALVGAVVGDVLGVRPMALALAGVALVFCVGLAAINHRLHRATAVNTPWKESLGAVAAIAAGLVLALL